VTGRIAFGLLCALRATLIFGEVSAAHEWRPSWPRVRVRYPRTTGDTSLV